MPYITYSSGLTIKSPTRGTRNYESTMRTDTYQKISEHDHTGGGRGVQLGAGAIPNDLLSDLKIRLRNDQYLRARNALDSADINILKVNASNIIEFATPLVGSNIADNTLTDIKTRLRNNQFLRARNAADSGDVNIIKVNADNILELGSNVHITSTISLTNNTSTTLGLTLNPLKVIGASIEYSVKRVGSSTVVEAGNILLKFDGTAWEMSSESLGSAGITFSISALGVISYVTSNLAGHVSSNMYLLAMTTGV